jgi:hypothetical protein
MRRHTQRAKDVEHCTQSPARQVHLRARRRALFADFLELWRDLDRKGFAARLAFALSERSHSSA